MRQYVARPGQECKSELIVGVGKIPPPCSLPISLPHSSLSPRSLSLSTYSDSLSFSVFVCYVCRSLLFSTATHPPKNSELIVPCMFYIFSYIYVLRSLLLPRFCILASCGFAWIVWVMIFKYSLFSAVNIRGWYFVVCILWFVYSELYFVVCIFSSILWCSVGCILWSV